MSMSHEAIPVLEDAPTPEQLFRLAGRSAVLAKQQGRLKPNRLTEKGRSHFMMPMTETIVPDVLEAPLGYRYEERYAARIARTDFRTWSMRLFHTYAVIDAMSPHRASARHIYSFEWGRNHTKLARQQIDILPVPDFDIYDAIDNFHTDDDIALQWDVQTQLEAMSGGDVDLLIHEVELFTGN